MSQHDLPKDAAPILHHYDPRQPVTLPFRTSARPVDVTQAADALPAAAADKADVDAVPAEKPATSAPPAVTRPPAPDRPVEIGGPSGPEPTRYGDWERNGRVSDF